MWFNVRFFHHVYYVSKKKSPQVNRIELINVDNINHCFLSLFYQCLQLFGQPVKCLHVVE